MKQPKSTGAKEEEEEDEGTQRGTNRLHSQEMVTR